MNTLIHMQPIYILNIVSLAVIAGSCLFMILSPRIQIVKPMEWMMWLMIFVSVGMMVEGMDSNLNLIADVSFRVWLAIFSVIYTYHKYTKTKKAVNKCRRSTDKPAL